MTVGAVGELEAEHLGIVLRLLHCICRRLVGDLRLDDRERKVARVAEQIVHALRRLADEPFAHRHDAAIGDRALLSDGVRLVVPAGRCELGDDVLAAGVGFGDQRRPA